MWYLLRRTRAECRSTQDCLEQTAVRHWSARTAAELMEDLSAAEREHIATCGNCREAAENLVATRSIFRGAARAFEPERPFFASRVLAAIASKEREIAELISPWSEVPRFATKLAWVTAVLLLAGTTWIYERGITAASHSPSGMAGPESIFEPTSPASQDDVLISMAESHP